MKSANLSSIWAVAWLETQQWLIVSECKIIRSPVFISIYGAQPAPHILYKCATLDTTLIVFWTSLCGRALMFLCTSLFIPCRKKKDFLGCFFLRLQKLSSAKAPKRKWCVKWCNTTWRALCSVLVHLVAIAPLLTVLFFLVFPSYS